jgi:hydroxymethylpyrimidine/phosphomethylpyrimidine kinase
LDGRVLIIAGSDSGGGAGIQADIKTVSALNGFATTAITALTAQNTLGVHAILPIDTDFIARQMIAVLDDIGADCIKTGMLHSAPVIECITAMIAQRAADVPLVVDPVMVAKGGAPLLETSAIDAVARLLIPLATVATPNTPEATALTGIEITGPKDQHRAGEKLIEMGCGAALVKGGHLPGETVIDVLVSSDGEDVFEAPRIATSNTHGTGCTMASAIATGLAQQMSLVDAVARAHRYVAAAIATAPNFGKGHGPLNHGVRINEPTNNGNSETNG